jgi:hypothetical protein
VFQSDKWTKKQEQEALAAICSLKRALGIADSPDSKDEFVGDTLRVGASTLESAELIAELFHKYAGCKKVVPDYSVPPLDPVPMRNTVSACLGFRTMGPEDYCASIKLKNISDFTRAINRIIEKHIAPDRRFTR